MRCSSLPLLSLFFAIPLLITDISSNSSTNHGRYEEPIGFQQTSSRSLDIPHSHALTRRAAPDWDNRHIRHKKDRPHPSKHPSPAHIQRHNHIMDHLRHHSSSSALAKRSLAGDLIIMGFRLIWDHADVIVSSILAYQRTSEYYANMSMRADGEFGSGPTVVITYGVFRLTFAIVADAVMGMAAEFAELLPNGFGEFVKEFALLMYLISLTVVIGTYTVLALAARVAVWITMVIVDNADLPRIVSGP